MPQIEYRRVLPDGSFQLFEDKVEKEKQGQYYDDLLQNARRSDVQALDFLCFGKEQSYPNRDLDRVLGSYILHYVTDGCGTYDGRKITRGNGFLSVPGKRHRMVSDRETPWHFYWIAFGGSDATRQMKSIGLDENHLYFSFSFFDKLDLLFDDVIYQKHSDCDMDLYMLGIFYMLMAYHRGQRLPGGTGENYAREAAAYMDAHFSENLKISDLAEKLHISRKHLCLVFERYAGMPAKEYLLMRRVEAASRLLIHTDMTVPEIAAEVGYGDYTQLSRLFRQKKGCSPQKFRRDNFLSQNQYPG